jgi:hypothetical protein
MGLNGSNTCDKRVKYGSEVIETTVELVEVGGEGGSHL